ncbi:MAG: glycosyltransferase family A protein [Bacillota bacterium]
MNKLITIFTPTYNRSNLLHKCYESLKRQTVKNFEWLVIDDGSTDDTKSLINNWIQNESEFTIKYVYKENGGLHSGYNEAIKHLETELSICIDSDDYLTDNCVELIQDKWKKNGTSEFAGILGLDILESGEILGGSINGINTINLFDLTVGNLKLKQADRKPVIRTDLYKNVAPMPTFIGEKNFNPHYMHLQISKEYDFLVLNEPLCIVEYQVDGMSQNMWWQYYNSPNSFLETRKLYLTYKKSSLKFKAKTIIHLIASGILSKKSPLKECQYKVACIFLYPLGLALVILIKNKVKKR